MKLTKTYEIPSAESWSSVLDAWIRTLHGNEIIMLSGPMGAGKTTFVRTLVTALQCSGSGNSQETPPVASPTFALHHQYILPANSKRTELTIDHWVLYRLHSFEELDSAGFWELLATPSLVIIEWPERIPEEDWPGHRVRWQIQIEVPAGNQSGDTVNSGRQVTITQVK